MCDICYEDDNVKLTSHLLKCCDLKICIDCFKQFLLLSTSLTHDCPKCHSTISYFDILCLPHKWVNSEYKKHITKLLFENEIISKMNETMIFLDRCRQLSAVDRLIDEEKEAINKFKKENEHLDLIYIEKKFNCGLMLNWREAIQLYASTGLGGGFPKFGSPKYLAIKNLQVSGMGNVVELDDLDDFNHFETEIYKPYTQRLKEMRKMFVQNERKRREEIREIRVRFASANETKEEEEKQTIIYKCQTENCRGMMDKNFYCLMCEVTFCKHCFTSTNNIEMHVCDPKNIETVKLIKKGSKNCPKCHIMIFKTGGCSQIFCTNCGTAFDWNTMQIENGIIHNPHAHQYFQNHPEERDRYQERLTQRREQRNNNCNILPDFLLILPNGTNFRINFDIHEFFRTLQHFYHMEVPFIVARLNNIQENRDLRIQYLYKQTTDKNLLTTLQTRYKKRLFTSQMHIIVMNTLNIFGNELWNLSGRETQKDLENFRDRVFQIMDETNEMISNLETIFKYSYVQKRHFRRVSHIFQTRGDDNRFEAINIITPFY